MAGPSQTLAFALSESDIKAALDLLRGRRPKNSYREIWILLTIELERRRLKAPPVDIHLARDAFEALPPEVQELLRRTDDGGKRSSQAGLVVAQSRGGRGGK